MRNAAPAVFLAVIALVVSVWFLSPADRSSASSEASAARREQLTERHEAPAVVPLRDRRGQVGEVVQPRRSPNGMPLPEDHEEKTSAFPVGQPRLEPLDSPGDWVGVRAEAHQRWIEQSLVALEYYQEREQLSDEDYQGLQAAYAKLHDSVQQTRLALEAGSMHPMEGRGLMDEARETASAEIAAIVGGDEMEMMRLEMIKRVRGGAF